MAAREPKKKAPRQTAAQKHEIKRAQFLIEIAPKLQFDEKPMFRLDPPAPKGDISCVEIALGCSLVEGTPSLTFGYPTTSDFYAESQTLGARIDRLNLEMWGYAHGCTAICLVDSEIDMQKIASFNRFRISRNTVVAGVEAEHLFATTDASSMIGTAWIDWTNELCEFIVQYDNRTALVSPCTQRMCFRDSSLLCHQSELHVIAQLSRPPNESLRAMVGAAKDLVHTETVSFTQWHRVVTESGTDPMHTVLVHHPGRWTSSLAFVNDEVPTGAAAAAAAATADVTQKSARDELGRRIKLRESTETLIVSDAISDVMKEHMFPILFPLRLRMYLRKLVEDDVAAAAAAGSSTSMPSNGEVRILVAHNASLSETLKSRETTVENQLDIVVLCCDSIGTSAGAESSAMRAAFPSDYCVPGSRDATPTESKLGTWSSAVVKDGATVIINLFVLAGGQLCLKALRLGAERLAKGLEETIGKNVMKFVTLAMCQRAWAKHHNQENVLDVLCWAFEGTGITIKLFPNC